MVKADITGVPKDFGSAGLTGLTRVTVVVTNASATSIVFELPKTFIPRAVIPGVMKADGSAMTLVTALSYSSENDQYTATVAAAPGIGGQIILIGELGRRDIPAENPNPAGMP